MTEAEWLVSSDPQAMLLHLTAETVGTSASYVYASRPGGRGPVHQTRKTPLASDRKLRLFAVAYCRLRWNEFDAPSRDHVEQVERYADGEGSLPAYDPRVHVVAWSASHLDVLTSATACLDTSPQVRKQQADLLRCIIENPYRPVLRTSTELYQVQGVNVAWRFGITPQVVSLAQAAYDERPGRRCEGRCHGYNRPGFYPDDTNLRRPHWLRCPDCHGAGRLGRGRLDPARLAVLADALEEAGCPIDACEDCGGLRTRAEHTLCVACGGWIKPHPLLAHLRSPGPHVRGCHAVDLCLGKE